MGRPSSRRGDGRVGDALRLRAFEITIAPSAARPRPRTRRPCATRVLQALVESTIPISTETIGFETETVATESPGSPPRARPAAARTRRSRRMRARTAPSCRARPATPSSCSVSSVGLVRHADRPKSTPADDADERGLAQPPPLRPAATISTTQSAPTISRADRPLVVRRVVLPLAGLPKTAYSARPSDDDRGAEHLPRGHDLRRDEVAERQGEDDGADEQRLDDRDPPAVERDRLRHVADEERGRPAQPPRALAELEERLQPLGRDAELERAALLEGRGDREEERRDDGEDGRHGRP